MIRFKVPSISKYTYFKRKPMLKKLVLFCALFWALAPQPSKSIVKITSSVSYTTTNTPWQNGKIQEFSGSGAHYCWTNDINFCPCGFWFKTHSNFKRKWSKKYTANIKYISHQTELQPIEIKRQELLEGSEAFKSVPMFKQGDTITVLGFLMEHNHFYHQGSFLALSEPCIHRLWIHAWYPSRCCD